MNIALILVSGDGRDILHLWKMLVCTKAFILKSFWSPSLVGAVSNFWKV